MSANNTECGKEGDTQKIRRITHISLTSTKMLLTKCYCNHFQIPRRAPLSPEQVRVLIGTYNFRVIVQPSSLRIFSNDEYIKAGAVVDEDLSEACLILGIKKMSVKTIQSDKSYMFFGHVIKAQKANFDILDKLLNSKVILI